MKITVYGTMTCPYCYALKDWLDGEKVKYDFHFVDHDRKMAAEMAELNADGGVPFSVVEFDGGSKENILGFDREKFTEVLGKGDKND